MSSQSAADRESRGASESSRNGESGDAGLTKDMTFDVLRNQRRRQVLHYLDENREPVPIGRLSEHIAALENDKPVETVSASERKRVYVGLYQSHLPKMDGLDVVEFDKDRGVVALGPNAALLDPYLDQRSDGYPRPWHRYYATIGSVGLLLVAASLLVAGLPTVGVALAVILGFVACATAHAVAERTHDRPVHGRSNQ